MAQRTIHYLFGENFSKQIELKDKNRFLLGSVMPDASTGLCVVAKEINSAYSE